MKYAKKLLAILCTAALCLSAAALSAFAAPAAPKLQYGSDGKFKILTFADTHLTAAPQPKLITFLGEAIDAAQPDLVVFLGDNVYSSAGESEEAERAAIALLLSPLLEREQRFALVFGNHDPEYKAGSIEDVMRMYHEIGGELCLAIDEGAAVDGCGNYTLPIYGSGNAEKIVSNLYFVDAGTGRGPDGKGYRVVSQNQIDWTTAASDALKAQNGGKPVPSLLFQHIIVPEIYDDYYSLPFELPFEISFFEEYLGKVRSPMPNFLKIDGYVMEPSCPPHFTQGQFDALVAQGDVMAMISGHDHVNNFTAPMRGINIEQISGATFDGSYNAAPVRGATLFTLDEAKPWSYEKKLITYWQLSLRSGSEIGSPYKNFEDVLQWIPYTLEFLLLALLSPVKWLTRALG